MTRVEINEKALVARITRSLVKDGRKLHASRTELSRAQLGDYFITRNEDSEIERTGLVLEQYARENGFLKPYEVLVK